jgi:hypothetical protein
MWFRNPIGIVHVSKHLSGLSVCLVHSISLMSVRPEIFEHVQTYLRYFFRIFREYVQYIQCLNNKWTYLYVHPIHLGRPIPLQTSNMTILNPMWHQGPKVMAWTSPPWHRAKSEPLALYYYETFPSTIP